MEFIMNIEYTLYEEYLLSVRNRFEDTDNSS